MTTTPANDKAPAEGRSVALWAGVIGAPAAWGLQLQAGYSLTPWACRAGLHFTLHVITAVAVVLALAGAYLSWRAWLAAGGGSPDKTDGGPVARERFLGALGVAMGALSAVVIVAQGIASFYFDGCWS